MVTVRVPATTANLGPGFDTLGLALALYNTLTFEELAEGLYFEGVDPEYATAENLAVVAYKAVLSKLGLPCWACASPCRRRSPSAGAWAAAPPLSLPVPPEPMQTTALP